MKILDSSGTIEWGGQETSHRLRETTLTEMLSTVKILLRDRTEAKEVSTLNAIK